MSTPRRNWAENVTYTSSGLVTPTTVDELREVVARSPRVRALGSRHSFNDAGDTDGLHVSVAGLPLDLALDGDVVRSSAGATHAQVSTYLHERGRAMPNLASLPQISVAGAIQTGTHGSGVRNPGLAAHVRAVEVVTADGEARTVRRGDEDFAAVVVGLGAFGVVTAVEQEVVEAFDVEQRVHLEVPWDRLLERLEDVLAGGYSVSLFDRYDGDAVSQVWVKQAVRDGDAPAGELLASLGGREAPGLTHMLPGTPTTNLTPQLGEPGPSYARLPHFRHDVEPGRGDEIQSEYFVDAARGVEAIEAVRRLGAVVAPVLHVSEVRRIAADDAWLSPSGGRDSMALHFTWKREPERVAEVVALLEAELLPLGARPHWGKVFTCGSDVLREAYPRLDDFAAAVARWDPERCFGNAFLRRVLGD